MLKIIDNFWQNLGFCLLTTRWFWQFFYQKKEWIGIFLPKNENISGKTWILSTNDPVVLAMFLPKKGGLAFLFCQKTKIFLATNDPVVLAIFWPENIFGQTLDFVYQRPGGFGNFSAKKEWIGIFFFAKNENWHDIKIGKHTKNAILVNLF